MVSLSWVLVVTAVPAHDRPFVDGSANNSELAQVFVYNGIDRFGFGSLPHAGVVPEGPLEPAANSATAHIPPSWHRLLDGPLGRDIGWLLPAALVAVVGLAILRRKAPRTDPVRAACLLWGSWVALLLAAFSAGRWVNSYYTAALAPGVAALFGVGASYVWAHRSARVGHRVAIAAVVTGSVLYALVILDRGARIPVWVTVVAITLTALVDLLVLVPRRDLRAAGRPVSLGMLLGLGTLLFIPSVASANVVARGLGPFDTPFEPASVAQFTEYAPQRFATRIEQASATIPASMPRSTILFATDTSGLAADYILYTGREVLPIGGYSGAAAEPTLARIEQLVHTGRLDDVVIPVVPPSTDPRVLWVQSHCTPVRRLATPASGGGEHTSAVLWTYACARRPARPPAPPPDLHEYATLRIELQTCGRASSGHRGTPGPRCCGCARPIRPSTSSWSPGAPGPASGWPTTCPPWPGPIPTWPTGRPTPRPSATWPISTSCSWPCPTASPRT